MQIIVFVAVILIFVAIELLYYREHAMDDLDLDVSFSKSVASYNEVIEIIEVAQNNKRLPLPFLLLKFESPTAVEFLDMTNTSVSDLLYREDMLTMKALSKHTRKIKARCVKRGYYSFPRVTISSTDLLFIEKLGREFPNNANLTILPQPIPSYDINTLLSITLSDIQQKRTLLTDPFSFAGIREYQPWDPMRSINWTASAKVGELMVNQQASTSTRKVSVFVNLEYYNPKKSGSLLEKSISLTYSYICELAESGIQMSVFTNGKDAVDNSTTSAIGIASDISKIVVDLGRIDLTKEVMPFDKFIEENIDNTSAGDYVVVISPKNDLPLQNTIIELKRKRPSLLWVMPAYKTSLTNPVEPELSDSFMRWEVLGHD